MGAIVRRQCQVTALAETTKAIIAGHQRICVTSPTGSGKTQMMIDMIEWARSMNQDVALYTNRRSLCEQTKRVLESHGLEVGMRAAGHETATLRPIQLCMTQTEGSRVFRAGKRKLHPAKLVLVDEAHIQGGKVMEDIILDTVSNGGHVVGYTATPLDMSFYDHMVVASKMSQCFKEGSLVPAHSYAPDEPDMRAIKRYNVGQDLTDKDNRKAIMRPGIFGRVFEHWKRLNPDAKPTILFGPDVAGSLWFAEQFVKQGVRAAHIDGQQLWLDGDFIDGSPEGREYVFDLVRSGEVPVICNRFVLREGIDMRELQHGILATVFGALSSYLQSCGRLLRACDGKEFSTLQDHGGNCHRLGSVNVDREWTIGMTNSRTVGERHERMRSKIEEEPWCCPSCYCMQMGGGKCRTCGYEFHDRSRLVIQVDGSLKEVLGKAYKPRIVKQKPGMEQQWERIYWSHRRINRTFNQAYGWFYQKYRYWPPRDLPYMPKEGGDWYEKIGKVPDERLHDTKQPQGQTK